MVKYRAAIWSFLKLTGLYFTMSDIVHKEFIFSAKSEHKKLTADISLKKIFVDQEVLVV